MFMSEATLMPRTTQVRPVYRTPIIKGWNKQHLLKTPLNLSSLSPKAVDQLIAQYFLAWNPIILFLNYLFPRANTDFLLLKGRPPLLAYLLCCTFLFTFTAKNSIGITKKRDAKTTTTKNEVQNFQPLFRNLFIGATYEYVDPFWCIH